MSRLQTLQEKAREPFIPHESILFGVAGIKFDSSWKDKNSGIKHDKDSTECRSVDVCQGVANLPSCKNDIEHL